MKRLFELEWMGGAAERHFRKLRPFVDSLPWGTIDRTRYPAVLVERARTTWTAIAMGEYAAAIGFANVIEAMLVARAPLDLIGMGGDFIADETAHAELASRLAMELGGGAPFEVDLQSMVVTSDRTDPFERANDLALRVACIGETFSGVIAASMQAVVDHPLIGEVVQQIARDEARHMRLGWLYLEWAAPRMSDGERARLAEVAVGRIIQLAPNWTRRTSTMRGGVTSEGFRIEHVHELGWLDSETHRARAEHAVLAEICQPLAALGIAVDRSRLPLLGT